MNRQQVCPNCKILTNKEKLLEWECLKNPRVFKKKPSPKRLSIIDSNSPNENNHSSNQNRNSNLGSRLNPNINNEANIDNEISRENLDENLGDVSLELLDGTNQANLDTSSLYLNNERSRSNRNSELNRMV